MYVCTPLEIPDFLIGHHFVCSISVHIICILKIIGIFRTTRACSEKLQIAINELVAAQQIAFNGL